MYTWKTAVKICRNYFLDNNRLATTIKKDLLQSSRYNCCIWMAYYNKQSEPWSSAKGNIKVQVQWCINEVIHKYCWHRESTKWVLWTVSSTGPKNSFCVLTDELLRAKDDLLSEGGQSLSSLTAQVIWQRRKWRGGKGKDDLHPTLFLGPGAA